jgi:hypothetical protein
MPTAAQRTSYLTINPRFESPLTLLKFSASGVQKVYVKHPHNSVGHWSVQHARFAGADDDFLVVSADNAFGSEGFFVYTTASGKALWNNDTGGEFIASEGDVAVLTTFNYEDNQMWYQQGTDLTTGIRLWRALGSPLPSVRLQQGAAGNGFYYAFIGECAGPDAPFYVLSLKTGRVIQQLDIPVACSRQYNQPPFPMPIVTASTVFYLDGNKVTAVNLQTSATSTVGSFQSPSFLSTNIDQTTLYIASYTEVAAYSLHDRHL